MTPLLVVDGHHLLYRSWWGFADRRIMSRDRNRDLTSVFGFLAILRKTHLEAAPDHEAIVVFDGENAAASTSLYAARSTTPNYAHQTATRSPGWAQPERLAVQRRRFLALVPLPLAAASIEPAEATARARTAAKRGTIGRAELVTVRSVIATFAAEDERLGGGVGRTAVAEYLATDATVYLRGRYEDGRTRAEMYGAVAELARLAGWTAHDTRRPGLAQRYYLYAERLAAESAPGHAAFVRRLRAHHAIDLGHGRLRCAGRVCRHGRARARRPGDARAVASRGRSRPRVRR